MTKDTTLRGGLLQVDAVEGGGPPPTAAALVIGNELLSGKVQDENLIVLARALRDLGIKLCRVEMVLDDVQAIVGGLRSLSAAFDYVFTSGGVGPTHDDVTMEAAALAFDVELVQNEVLAELLREHYGSRTTEAHLRMAAIPVGARIVECKELSWPTVVMKNVWLLPGVPEAFSAKIAVVRRVLERRRPFVSHAIYTCMDEGDLKPLLDQVVEEHPAVEVGSYPQWRRSDYKTKLTFDGRDERAVKHAVEAFVRLLPPGEPQSIEDP